MNVFIFVFLSAAVVTAAPHAAPTSNKHQHKSGKQVNCTGQEHQQKSLESRLLLQYIIQKVMHLEKNPSSQMLQEDVQNVFANEECNCRTLCKAGKVLQAYNASTIRLKGTQVGKLSRLLLAYSNQNCTVTDKQEYVPLRQLLDEIRRCGQEEHANLKI